MILKSTVALNKYVKQLPQLSVLCVLGMFNNNTYANPLDLAQVIDLAQKQQAMTHLWQAQTAWNQANLNQAKVWQNPEVSFEQTGFDKNKDRETAIAISQSLDIFGERQAQQDLAQLNFENSQLQQQRYVDELRLVSMNLWSQWAISELEQQNFNAQTVISAENLVATQRRYQAGSIAKVEVDRVQLNYLEDQRALAQVQSQSKTAWQRLYGLLGKSANDLNKSFQMYDLWPNLDIENEKVVKNYLYKSYVLQQQQSQATAKLLKIQAKPQPTMSFGVNRAQSNEQDTQQSLVLGVSVPLSIFNRNQYQLQKISLKNQWDEEKLKLNQQQITLDIQRIKQEIHDLKNQYQLIENSQLGLAQQIQQKTLQGFQAGKFSIADVQLSSMQLHNIRLRKIELLKEAWQKTIRLQSLSLGIDPEIILSANALQQIQQRLTQDLSVTTE